MLVMVPHPLSAAELLEAAATCRERPPVNAGVYLAALGARELSNDEAIGLPIGERDTMLTRLYASMFGSRLELATNCPYCAARLDVSLTTDELLIEPATDAYAPIEIDRRRFEVRPVNSADLAAAAAMPDVETARALLALRCLVPVDGEAGPDTLSNEEIDAVAAALAVLDPASDRYVPLRCFSCEATWDAPIDIARTLAAEIESAADTLMDDIHDLALSYHWSEEAILALAPSRRRAYLQRLRG
jgi:hypothetical protein